MSELEDIAKEIKSLSPEARVALFEELQKKRDKAQAESFSIPVSITTTCKVCNGVYVNKYYAKSNTNTPHVGSETTIGCSSCYTNLIENPHPSVKHLLNVISCFTRGDDDLSTLILERKEVNQIAKD